ncbi:TonB family protein [Hymenobacter crusticola]|uniref:TonB C-terminal domain-containing protein n=1 Tax=Hymenobacter crusticola TaxID=1770526 RepID=A0A243WJA4_9BACT|nr:TonB family protein [Hymenobacter crusticola]OUJ75982.1 hypothetical protein BXP70_01485 [Hymenobacter crusticola]
MKRFAMVLALLCYLGLTSTEVWAQVKGAHTRNKSDSALNTDIDMTGLAVKDEPELRESPVYNQCFMSLPVYKKGGTAGMIRFIKKNIHYPENKTIQGKVLVSFVIDKTGKVRAPKITQGLEPSFDAEALRVVQLLGDFTSTQNDILYTVPITFSLK